MSTRHGRATATIHEAVAVYGNLLGHIRSSSSTCRTCFLFFCAVRVLISPGDAVRSPSDSNDLCRPFSRCLTDAFFVDVIDIGFRLYVCMNISCRFDVFVQGNISFATFRVTRGLVIML